MFANIQLSIDEVSTVLTLIGVTYGELPSSILITKLEASRARMRYIYTPHYDKVGVTGTEILLMESALSEWAYVDNRVMPILSKLYKAQRSIRRRMQPLEWENVTKIKGQV